MSVAREGWVFFRGPRGELAVPQATVDVIEGGPDPRAVKLRELEERATSGKGTWEDFFAFRDGD